MFDFMHAYNVFEHILDIKIIILISLR